MHQIISNISNLDPSWVDLIVALLGAILGWLMRGKKNGGNPPSTPTAPTR